MKPIRGTLARVLLLLTLLLPSAAACGSGAEPGGSPSASPTPTASTSASPSPSPTPSPSVAPTTAAPTTAPALPGWTVVSTRLAYQWHWPGNAVTITHTYPVPPVAQLVTIGAGDHPRDPGGRPYNRMSFSFTTGYPTYTFGYVDRLVADGSGLPVPLEGRGVLRIVFTPAQAHNTAGTASSIQSRPPAHLGMTRMVAYAPAGDFEGYLTYGVGITWPTPHANPQIAVRVYEVTYVDTHGAHRYVVAFDVDATR